MHKKTFYICYLLSLLTLVIPGYAATFTIQNAPYPGGIAIIALPINTGTEPHVYFAKQRILVIKKNNQWYALVGIPLTSTPGNYTLTVQTHSGKAIKQKFSIANKIYPLRYITIDDKSKVTPNPALARKIDAQTKQMQTLLNTWDQSITVPTTFILPAKGQLSSGFGIRRIYNRVKPGRHTGLDIAAPTGTPIVATANGRVLATEDYIITGNTVILDHGQGLISFYCHMNSVAVKPGQSIRQGELLGTVGMTGRVTGPHLHWGMVLNGTKVNPLLFVKQATG